MRESNSSVMQQQQRFQRNLWQDGSGFYRYFVETMWQPFVKSPARSSFLFFSVVLLFVGGFICARWFDSPIIYGSSVKKEVSSSTSQTGPDKTPRGEKTEIPLNCSAYNVTQTCPTNYPMDSLFQDDHECPICPDYFRWIHEDLRPWAGTGITREMVEGAKRTANFRLVIVKGRAYLETYEKGFQTRDVFTLWGILQLLRKYPGKVPDLEFMFDCVDWPVIMKSEYRESNATAPPPLFRYCGNGNTFDIVFPDWSFWGWAEVNIKPWESLSKDLKEGNKRTRWMDREPYAYWKGNPEVAETRKDLVKCNVSEAQDWGARIYAQDWGRESQQGYKQSNLASQCVHRYKIYIEGSAWSVSEKYILACDSVTFIVRPHYYDFFTRGLMPMHHYWPIKEDDKCRSIKFAVDWGNSHEQKAQDIGKAASTFIQEDLKMDYVYDYMFHLLKEYAELLRFKPTIPLNATELCSETMACSREGLEKKFMMDSLVKSPADTAPCTMPPPYDPPSLLVTLTGKENSLQTVDRWEKKYWKNQKMQSSNTRMFH